MPTRKRGRLVKKSESIKLKPKVEIIITSQDTIEG